MAVKMYLTHVTSVECLVRVPPALLAQCVRYTYHRTYVLVNG